MSTVLDAFLSYEGQPEAEVYIRRFDQHFKIRALTNEEFDEIKEEATREYGTGKNRRKEIDENDWRSLIIAKGVTEPDFSHKEVLKKFNVGTGAEAVLKGLLAGELKILQAEIFNISGFDNDYNEEKVEEAKKLIKAGGEAYLLYVIFRDKNIPPDEMYKKPKNIRNFMYASVQLEHEEKKEAMKQASKKGG